MDKKSKLLEIAKEIVKCKVCKKDKFGLPVPGEGNQNAKIMFIGEAPGIEESKVGKPFVGRAGKFLNNLLDAIEIKREEVFITSPLKYYPGRRAIRKEEIEHGRIHLQKQIVAINPKLIVLLGNVAIKAALGESHKLSKIHGKIIKRNNILYFSTFHPAAGTRFPKIREKITKDFMKLKKIIKSL